MFGVLGPLLAIPLFCPRQLLGTHVQPLALLPPPPGVPRFQGNPRQQLVCVMMRFRHYPRAGSTPVGHSTGLWCSVSYGEHKWQCWYCSPLPRPSESRGGRLPSPKCAEHPSGSRVSAFYSESSSPLPLPSLPCCAAAPPQSLKRLKTLRSAHGDQLKDIHIQDPKVRRCLARPGESRLSWWWVDLNAIISLDVSSGTCVSVCQCSSPSPYSRRPPPPPPVKWSV